MPFKVGHDEAALMKNKNNFEKSFKETKNKE